MKWSTPVACLILCFLEPKRSDGAAPVVPCPLAETTDLVDAAADQCPAGCTPSAVASLLTALCAPATVAALPPAALVSVVDALSADPQLCAALPPSALTAVLGAVSSSPDALKILSPVAVLVLLSAASPSISDVPPAVLFPLIRTLSESGVLPASGRSPACPGPLGAPPATVYAQLPPLPAPSRQVIVPGPAPGPIYINLPRKPQKPPPIVVPTGPPQSIVVSIPQQIPAPPPLIAPYGRPGPIVISDEPNAPPAAPIVVPAPPPPNIYITTHPSRKPGNGKPGCTGQPFEMPRVYALPPGVSPSQYFQASRK